MKNRKLIKEATRLAAPYCVTDGEKFRLKDFDPGDTSGMKSKKHAESVLRQSSEMLTQMQEKLYAQDRWAVLLIFQGMDAAGKDGAIKHVMSGVNPEGCQVYSFKVPTEAELRHDFLWRTTLDLPQRGHIGIFNRSYYEEVLIVRVHPEVLKGERVPSSLLSKNLWSERFEDIRSFERHLARDGTVIRKFFLNISKKEQKRRFLARLDQPEKNWKFSAADIHERRYWDDYMNAYEDMIRNTASKYAPWYAVPADNKWFTRLVVSSVIVDALEELDLSYPQVDAVKRKELAAARKLLLKK